MRTGGTPLPSFAELNRSPTTATLISAVSASGSGIPGIAHAVRDDPLCIREEPVFGVCRVSKEGRGITNLGARHRQLDRRIERIRHDGDALDARQAEWNEPPELPRRDWRRRRVERFGTRRRSAVRQISKAHSKFVGVTVAERDDSIVDGGVLSERTGMSGELQIDRILGDQRSSLPLRKVLGVQ